MLKRVSDTLQSWISPLYAAMICGISAICIFLPGISHGSFRIAIPWPILLACGAVFFVGLMVLINRCCRWPVKLRWLLLCAFVLMMVQIIAVYQYYFYTDWDIRMIMGLSDAFAHGTDQTHVLDYFSTYPNNLLLAWFFGTLERAVHSLGLHEWEYFSLLCVQSLFCAATGVLVFLILEKLFGDVRLSVFGYVMYNLLVGISPWVSIPYSDSIGLLFPTLILFLYVYRDIVAHRWIPWAAIAFLSWIGYKIKPQILILLFAIVIIRFLAWVREEKSARCLRSLVAFAAGALCAVLLSHMAIASLKTPINPEKAFGFQHFFMMGFNPEAYGVWANEDVIFSSSFKTVDERNQADMERAVSRIRQMGPVGVAKQLVRKTLTNYHDGTFCWAGEGVFFWEILPEKNPPLSRFLRGIYYNRSQAQTGVNYAVWFNFEQMIWATVLVCSTLASLAGKNGDRDLIMLTIIGLTLFELLFEARARYLYIYAPFYIFLAVYGVNEFRKRLEQK